MGKRTQFSFLLSLLALAILPLFQNCSEVKLAEKAEVKSIELPSGVPTIASFGGWARATPMTTVCENNQAKCDHWRTDPDTVGLTYECSTASSTGAHNGVWTTISSANGAVPTNYPDALGACVRNCNAAFQDSSLEDLESKGLACRFAVRGTLSDFPFEHRNTFLDVGSLSYHVDAELLPWNEIWSWTLSRFNAWAKKSSLTTENLMRIKKYNYHIAYPESNWLSTEEVFHENFPAKLADNDPTLKGRLINYDASTGRGTGWACLINTNKRLKVRVWAASADDEHALLTETETNMAAEQAINDECQSIPGAKYKFEFQLSPSALASLNAGLGFCRNKLEVTVTYFDAGGVEKIFTIQDRLSLSGAIELPNKCPTF